MISYIQFNNWTFSVRFFCGPPSYTHHLYQTPSQYQCLGPFLQLTCFLLLKMKYNIVYE